MVENKISGSGHPSNLNGTSCAAQPPLPQGSDIMLVLTGTDVVHKGCRVRQEEQPIRGHRICTYLMNAVLLLFW